MKQHLIFYSPPSVSALQVGSPGSSTTGEPPPPAAAAAAAAPGRWKWSEAGLCPDRCSDNIPNKTPLIWAEMSPSAFCVLAFNFTKQKRAGGETSWITFPLFSVKNQPCTPPLSHPLHPHSRTRTAAIERFELTNKVYLSVVLLLEP